MSESLVLACPQCLALNRVATARLDDNPSCGKCSRDNLDVVLGEESPHSQRRASSYNRRTVSFCDDVGEIGPPLTDLTPATDSSSSSEVRT